MNARSIAPLALCLLACRPRATPAPDARAPRDGATELRDVRDAALAPLPEPLCATGTLRAARTVCGATLLCADTGRVQRLATAVTDESAPCLRAMYAVESAFDAGLARAERAVLTALAPVIDSEAEGPMPWPAEDDSCASRPERERTRLQTTARTRVLAWAAREGGRRAARATLSLTMRCPGAQGPAMVSAAFEGDGAVASRTFWRVDSQGATLVHAIDPRELRGAAWIDVDAEPGDELLLFTHAWEGSATALRALSLARVRPIELDRRDPSTQRVLVVRDEGRAVVLIDWIAHRWTGSALTPIAQPSIALRRTLARGSSVIDARATARDALGRVPIDAEALDDALAVAGLDEPGIRAILGALR